MIAKVNIAEKFGLFSDHWNPRVVGEVGDCAVKLVKLVGEFEWHFHAAVDEMFLVVDGRMRMKFRNSQVDLGVGELIIVSRGVEHKPTTLSNEVSVMLIEPKSTLNTGNVVNERTREKLERL